MGGRLRLFILFSMLFNINHVYSQTTTCTKGDVYLNVTTQKKYVTTPGYPDEYYPENIDCRFILKAERGHRILIDVEDLNMEKQLFDECLDHVGILKGSGEKITELCGVEQNLRFTSLDDSLIIKLSSDGIISGKGAKISYMAIADRGECEPGWVDNKNGTCLALFQPSVGIGWVEAQRRCFFQQSNLASITNEEAYNFAMEWLKNITSFPWTGYNDATVEGIFKTVGDTSTDSYPPNLPVNGNTDTFDCIYIDMVTTHVGKGETPYRTADCRNKQGYICSKNKDGTTLPYPDQTERIRNGYQQTGFNWTIWLLVILILVLLLIVIFLCCRSCKSCGAQNRVHATAEGLEGNAPPNTTSSGNDRTHVGQQQQHIKIESAPAQLQPSTSYTPVSTTVPVPLPRSRASLDNATIVAAQPAIHRTEEHLVVGSPKVTQQLADEPLSPISNRRGDTFKDIGPGTELSLHPRSLPPLPIREQTYHTLNTREESFLRSRRAGGDYFDRPKMSVLDNVSAISLDEFWSNNKK